MRLWHKDLIKVLPAKQLLAQWRECCAIVGSINKKGTPNHLLVNPVMNYNKSHFYAYCCMICNEMYRRDYKVSESSKQKIIDYASVTERQISSQIEKDGNLFEGWHNNRYFWQCYYNLQEKYDRGSITDKEWEVVAKYARTRNEKPGID